jgi:hypothetical protein
MQGHIELKLKKKKKIKKKGLSDFVSLRVGVTSWGVCRGPVMAEVRR